jgi:hypothetical protein
MTIAAEQGRLGSGVFENSDLIFVVSVSQASFSGAKLPDNELQLIYNLEISSAGHSDTTLP